MCEDIAEDRHVVRCSAIARQHSVGNAVLEPGVVLFAKQRTPRVTQTSASSAVQCPGAALLPRDVSAVVAVNSTARVMVHKR